MCFSKLQHLLLLGAEEFGGRKKAFCMEDISNNLFFFSSGWEQCLNAFTASSKLNIKSCVGQEGSTCKQRLLPTATGRFVLMICSTVCLCNIQCSPPQGWLACITAFICSNLSAYRSETVQQESVSHSQQTLPDVAPTAPLLNTEQESHALLYLHRLNKVSCESHHVLIFWLWAFATDLLINTSNCW